MASRLSSSDVSCDGSEEWEKEGLIQAGKSLKLRKAQSEEWFYSRAHIVSLYALISSLLLVSTSLTFRLHRKPFADPTLGVYCEIPYVTEDTSLIFLKHRRMKLWNTSKSKSSNQRCSAIHHTWAFPPMRQTSYGRICMIVRYSLYDPSWR